MSARYDGIGNGYNATRSADPRIVDRIVANLNLPLGSRILDVGAGTGSYSNALAERGYELTALEPSAVMRDQAGESGPVMWVEGVAESLPFETGSFDGAILILCLHHFSNSEVALAEIRRVVSQGPVVIFTYDPALLDGPWLFDYFPAFRDQIREAFLPVGEIGEFLTADGDLKVETFPLPADLADGFVGAAWRDPKRYLDREFRDGTSAFRLLDPALVEQGLEALALDLESGVWESKNGELKSRENYEMGYVFLTSRGG